MVEQKAIYKCREGQGEEFEVVLDPNDDVPADAIPCRLHPDDPADWAVMINLIVTEVEQDKEGKSGSPL